MDEKEMYGNKIAIDTDYERSILEYRPRVKYQPNKGFTVNLPAVESVVEQEDDTEDYTPEERPSQIYDDFIDLSNILTDMIETIEQEVQEVSIPISEEVVYSLSESFPSFNMDIAAGQSISFPDYKNTFDDPEHPGNSLLQDVVTSYAEDVEGSLELELYEDLKEIQSTLDEGYYLFKEAILKNYIDGSIPDAAQEDEDFLKQLDESVQKQREWFNHVTKTYEEKEEAYYESLKTDYGSPDFFKKSDEYSNSKRAYDIALREENSLNEMMSLVDMLLVGMQEVSNYVKSGLVLGSNIDEEEVMKVVENQATTKEELAELKKLTQLSLKLQLNAQIEDKKQYRDVLKNINNLSRKKRAHDELLTAFELRNKMYLKTYDMLQNLQSPSKDLGVEAFLNQVAGGLELVQDQYSSFLKDVYAMYVSEYEVRKEKILQTLNKEDTRAGYSLVLDHL